MVIGVNKRCVINYSLVQLAFKKGKQLAFKKGKLVFGVAVGQVSKYQVTQHSLDLCQPSFLQAFILSLFGSNVE